VLSVDEHAGTSAGEKLCEGLVFAFSSQGGQWEGMGCDLYRKEPVFRKAIERCDREIMALLGWSLAQQFARQEPYRLHAYPYFAQPAVTALQIGLSELLKSWGVRPSAVLGLSMGEAAAVYAAGILRLRDVLRIVASEAKVIELPMQAGRMVLIGADRERAAELAVELSLSIAVELSPRQTVLSGETGAVDRALARAREAGFWATAVPVPFAFHSPEIRTLEPAFLDMLGDFDPRPGMVPVFSTVTGRHEEGRVFQPYYWWRLMRDPALFASAARSVLGAGFRAFIEVGPHPMLLEPLKETAEASGAPVRVIPTLSRDEGEVRALQRVSVEIASL
jgi:acyl transferase domain-containing protein